MTAPAATHAELAHLIARGDRKRAASLLVRDHAPAVFALCRSMVRDPRTAEDLSQDAFARAFRALDGFRGEASPRTWLLKIARNRCLDHLARSRRAPWAGHDDPEPDDHAADEPPPYDLLARREDAERAMSALSETERALVVLHFGHGVGYPELADSFGLREGAVRMRISRALARMRFALAPPDVEIGAADFEHSASTRHPDARRGASLGSRFEEDTTVRSFAEADDEEATDEAATSVEMGMDTDLDTALDMDDPFADLEVGAAPLSQDTLATPAPPPPPPPFGGLREDLSPALLQRLDALAAAV
jgi:RNA polymerase sigma-70 factor (ECF subfamily)